MTYSRLRHSNCGLAVRAAVKLSAICAALAPSLGSGLSAYGQDIEILSPLHAQSVIVLRIEVDDWPGVGSVFVEYTKSTDEDFRVLELLNAGDAPIRKTRFSHTSKGRYVLIVPTFLTGAHSIETARHPFNEPGRYLLRVRPETAGHRVPPSETILAEIEIDLAKPSAADQKYFDLTRKDRFSSLVGLSKQDTTRVGGQMLVGLVLMGHIIESTQHVGDPTHGRSEWAAPLYDLAFAVPDSSYAPYLAYYSACSYMWQRKDGFVRREYGYELPNRRVTELEHYQRARKALEFAVERGDAYIKPFATYFLAVMKAWAGDWEGARELTRKAEEQAHESSRILHAVDELDRYIVEEERKVHR